MRVRQYRQSEKVKSSNRMESNRIKSSQSITLHFTMAILPTKEPFPQICCFYSLFCFHSSSSTRLWLEKNARRLLQVRSLLEEKLRRYTKIQTNRQPKLPLVRETITNYIHQVGYKKARRRTKSSLFDISIRLADRLRLQDWIRISVLVH